MRYPAFRLVGSCQSSGGANGSRTFCDAELRTPGARRPAHGAADTALALANDGLLESVVR